MTLSSPVIWPQALQFLQVWTLSQPTPSYTLEGHEKGVNCLDYFTGGQSACMIDGTLMLEVCAVWQGLAWMPISKPWHRPAGTLCQHPTRSVLRGSRIHEYALRPKAALAACLQVTAPTWSVEQMTSWSRCGTTRPRPACRHWRGTPTMCRLSASTQSCPSSSQVQNLALQQLRLHSMRAASAKLEGRHARPGHLLVSRPRTAQNL